MTIDPAKQVTGTPAAQGGSSVQAPRTARPADSAEIGKAMTKNGTNSAKNTGNMPENPGGKTGGIIFSKDALRKLETKEVRYKDNDGVFQTKTVYKATLTDGTVVEYEKQEPVEGEKGAYQQPQIRKNKDGSFDFEGLRRAVIYDTAKNDKYNIIGCKNVSVEADRGEDKDVIDNAKLRLDDGTILDNRNVSIHYNKGDKVTDLNTRVGIPESKLHDGSISLEFNGMYEYEDVGYGRTRKTHSTFGGSEIDAATYSHDGIELREDYVNATEQVLADGYKIKTSPDGKVQWFYTPDGKAISKEEFRNRGLE